MSLLYPAFAGLRPVALLLLWLTLVSPAGADYQPHQQQTDAEPSAALSWFLPRAIQGDVSAQYNAGLLYLEGIEVHQDLAAAEHWLQHAATQQHRRAQYKLGEFYFHQRQYQQALHWLEQASASIDPNADFLIGQMHFAASALVNLQQAEAAYLRAARLGHRTAQRQLGELYLRQTELHAPAQSLIWLSIAARNGEKANRLLAQAQALLSPSEQQRAEKAAREIYQRIYKNTPARPA